MIREQVKWSFNKLKPYEQIYVLMRRFLNKKNDRK